jgi:hypothetical protein
MAARVGRGITNQQAKYLAALCRELGVEYPGWGMTAREASITIDALKKRVRKRDQAMRRKMNG